MQPRTLTMGVVLAGGQSKRMGQDKALLKIKEKTLLTHTIDLLKKIKPKLCEIVVSGRKWDTPFIEDVYQNLGPLGGIYSVMRTVLTHSKKVEYLLVVPIDMPLITSNFFSNLISGGKSLQQFNAFIYKAKYFPLLLRVTDPVFEQFEKAVKQSLNAPKTSSLQVLLKKLNTYELDWNEPDKQLFANINTQEAWNSLES